MRGKEVKKKTLLDLLPANAKAYIKANNIRVGRIPKMKGSTKYKNVDIVYVDEGHNILENFLLVKHYMARRYDVDFRLFEILFYLYARNVFTGDDYYEMPKAFTHNKIRTLIRFGYIMQIHRGKNGSENLFTLTLKSKNMVRDFYEYLSGEKKIPEMDNPLNAEGATTIDKMRFNLIKKMNQLEPSEEKKRLYFGKYPKK